MKLLPAFKIGQTVYHKTNPDLVGIVTGITERMSCYEYGVKWSDDLEEKWHADFELKDERTFGVSENERESA
jgi:hypothetical protein